MKFLLCTLLIIVIGYISLCTVLYLTQRSMIYHPTPETKTTFATPFYLSNQNVKLKVWQHQPAKQQALIYFGGNAENVSLNIPQFAKIFPNHTVYLHNYRNYSGSEGKPTEEALYSDALLLYDHVKKKHKSIDIIGRSLGTGVATYLAANRKTNRLALITPFDSLTNVASSYFPFFPVTLLMHDRFESISHASSLTMPTLILIAENDGIIPFKNSNTLLEALDNKYTKAVIIPRADHNSISLFKEYEQSLSSFFNTY